MRTTCVECVFNDSASSASSRRRDGFARRANSDVTQISLSPLLFLFISPCLCPRRRTTRSAEYTTYETRLGEIRRCLFYISTPLNSLSKSSRRVVVSRHSFGENKEHNNYEIRKRKKSTREAERKRERQIKLPRILRFRRNKKKKKP